MPVAQKAVSYTHLLLVYKTWDFGILTYSSLIYTILASLGVLTVLQAILGREPKAVKA